jgi:hypothetical protein
MAMSVVQKSSVLAGVSERRLDTGKQPPTPYDPLALPGVVAIGGGYCRLAAIGVVQPLKQPPSGGNCSVRGVRRRPHRSSCLVPHDRCEFWVSPPLILVDVTAEWAEATRVWLLALT